MVRPRNLIRIGLLRYPWFLHTHHQLLHKQQSEFCQRSMQLYLPESRNKAPKRRKYKEEISPTLDYEYAKNEFAQAIELQYFKQGTVIVEQDTRGKGLYYVVSGKIDVTTSTVSDHEIFNSTRDKKKKKSKTLFTIESGGIAGYLSSLVSYKSFVTLIAKTDVYVGFLPYQTLENCVTNIF